MWLHCRIFKHKNTDCSNGGLSSKFDECMLATSEDDLTKSASDLLDKSLPLVKIIKRNLFCRDYYHAEPINPPLPGQTGYMFGGCFVSTCDGRFPFDYPLSLHDRIET